MSLIAILAVVFVICLFSLVGIFNSLVRKRNETDNAFAGVEVQLKMRYDLIPNLVAAVKGYMKHEQGILQTLTELRTQAVSPNLTVEKKVAVDNDISSALRNVLISVENYPDLKAGQEFSLLQRSLNEVESQISAARRAFNAATTNYNNAVLQFPSNVVAALFHFKSRTLFQTPELERQNLNVGALLKS